MTMQKERRAKKTHELDMTQGSIFSNLIRFATPLLMGNLFQQLYNLVDTWVIGQSGSNDAYAAVGSVGPIINILIGFFMGLSAGAGVVISQHFGAKDRDGVRRSVHTSMALTCIIGVVFTALGILMAPQMLDLMLHDRQDGQQVRDAALTYLTIYFGGILSMLIYNMGSAVLRAVGDSRRPLYYLIAAAVTNVVLDLVFVMAFDLGAAGVAAATVISQTLSAVLTLIALFRDPSWVQLRLRELKIHRDQLARIIAIGIPSAVQMALTAFANVFVQSYICGANGNMTYNLGGWTTYSKVDQLLFLPVQSLALAASTFVGQNLGGGDCVRARRGARTAYLMSSACSIVCILAVEACAPYLALAFNSDPEVVQCAVMLLRWITPFYFACSANQIFAASMRGAGNSRAPMIIMLSSFIAVRQIYLFFMTQFCSNDLLPIGMGYPVGWIACALCMTTYYLHFDFGKAKVPCQDPTTATEE